MPEIRFYTSPAQQSVRKRVEEPKTITIVPQKSSEEKKEEPGSKDKSRDQYT